MSKIILNYSPMPHQLKLHSDPSRFRVVVGGRRCGKSKSSFQELAKYALSHKNSLCWWVSPTYNEAREVGFSEFKDYQEQLYPAIHAVNEGIMRIVFKNGSKIYFKGADRKDSLRGRGLNFLCIDEFAFLEEDTWTKVLRPALSDKQGSAILTTTPNGRNWAYSLSNQIKKAKNSSYNFYQWTSYENLLMTHEEIAELKSSLSDIDFRQEILAEFITKSGQVYDDFNDFNITSDFFPDLEKEDIYIGADFGYANPSAFVFMAVNKHTHRVTQFAEIIKAHTNIQKLTEEIMQILTDYKIRAKDVKAIYTDPAGNADEITSGESPVDYLRKFFTVFNKGSKIAPGISLVRSWIKNAANVRSFFVNDTCQKTIESLYGYVYAPSNKNSREVKEEPFKDGINDHACDALRYFFVNCFPQNRYVSKKPEAQSYLVGDTKKPMIKKCNVCYNPFVSWTPKGEEPFLCPKCLEDMEEEDNNIWNNKMLIKGREQEKC